MKNEPAVELAPESTIKTIARLQIFELEQQRKKLNARIYDLKKILDEE